MPDIIIKGMEMPETCYSCPLKKRNGIEMMCPVLRESFSVADVNVLHYRLKDCPLRPAPEWISVDERLPENETEVLTLVKYKWAKKHYYSLDAYSHIDGGWVRNEGVTHWMPLPEPAAGGETDAAY